jgi:hypothetical protein
MILLRRIKTSRKAGRRHLKASRAKLPGEDCLKVLLAEPGIGAETRHHD